MLLAHDALMLMCCSDTWSAACFACSKRRPPDVMEVADQLQQLPALSAEQLPGTHASSTAGAGSSISSNCNSMAQRQYLLAKRLRLSGGNTDDQVLMNKQASCEQQQQQQLHQHGMAVDGRLDAIAAACPDNDAAATGCLAGHPTHPPRALEGMQQSSGFDSSSRLALPQQQREEVACTQGCAVVPSSSSSHQGHQHHFPHQASKLLAAGGGPVLALLPGHPAAAAHPAGLLPGLVVAGGLETQRQAQEQPSPAQKMMGPPGSSYGSGLQDMMDVSSEVLSLQQQQHLSLQQQQRQLQPRRQHHGGTVSSRQEQHPPVSRATATTALGSDAGRMAEERLRRNSSVIAMMQVTVTEALGLD